MEHVAEPVVAARRPDTVLRLLLVYVAGRAFSFLALGAAWFVANTVGRADAIRIDQGFLSS